MAAISATALATEGGGSIYPNGAENYILAAMPPPGLYGIAYIASYNANELRDNNGKRVPLDFDLDVSAVSSRLIWVTDQKLFGGQLAFHAIAPLVHISATVNGMGKTKSGLADVTFGPALGYHASENLHYVFVLDINAPTGQYNKNDLVNLGRNYWNLEPLFGVSYIQPRGLNADLKLMYDFNARNKDTDYRSGQEFHADYAIGWGFSPNFVAGVGGHVYKQTTDDELGGATVGGNRGRAFAIGPSIKYDNGKGWFLTAKYANEYKVKNRARGGGLNIKLSVPF
jgi:hypothetical protein